MLILTRRPDESIVITDSAGERIEVILLGVAGQQSRLGFDAPDCVTIHRKEIQDKIDRERFGCTREDEI